MQPGQSPLERLPEELKQQVMNYLSEDDLQNLGGASTAMLQSVYEYYEPHLAYLQQQMEAMMAQITEMNTALPNFFQNQ